MPNVRSARPSKLRLQTRDGLVLADVALHRALSRDHLLNLGHFGSRPRLNDRCRQLVEAGFLSRITGDATRGTVSIYTLGTAAIPLLVEGLGFDYDDLRRQVRDVPANLEHTLRVADFYVAVRREAGDHGVTIGSWLPERFAYDDYEVRSPTGSTWQRHVLKPDGYLRLDSGGAGQHCFLEVDRGFVNSDAFQAKVASYQRYERVFPTVYDGTDFSILVVTTSARRIAGLQVIAAGLGATNFRFTTFDDLRRFGAFAAIWRDAASGVAVEAGTRLMAASAGGVL